VERVREGLANLSKHMENAKKFGLKPVVAINHFISDTPEEAQVVIDYCAELGIEAVVSKGWAEGGEGCRDLAQAVVDSVEKGNNDFKPLYNWNLPVREKIEIIAHEIYGAHGVEFSTLSVNTLRQITKLGLDHLPICMAKTQYSFSDNEKLINRPKDFHVTVREIEIAAGAGFIIPILGKMMRMPGLPRVPAAEHMQIDQNGKISGLS
jgi:formate--tetrahydrofolate ligase